MWTDLFKSTTAQVPDRSVDRVDRGDDNPSPLSTAPVIRAAADPGVVAKGVDGVESRKIATVDTRHPISTSAAPCVGPGVPPSRAALPVVSVSDHSAPPTPSTRSTPGKCCRLLTAAEKNALLALFEADIALVEMEVRVSGREVPNELRRAINVVWRLVTVESWDFDTAAKAVAEWVVTQPMHPDELLFADVLSFSAPCAATRL